MPEIADGESVEVQGSASKPYVLTNTGGVYSCTCPAWRNQSIGIERRTCKHLRKYRGDQAEEDRLGGTLPAKALKSADDVVGPPVLLAHSWDCELDVTGWWISEKLDGVRAYWDGTKFVSRQGNEFMAPDWFVEGLPTHPLDGELWMERKAFQKTISIVKRQDRSERWKQIRYLIFDSPGLATPFEERMASLKSQFEQPHPYAQLLEHARCESIAHLRQELSRVESLGGEGLMVRQPGSRYEIGRSMTLLKIKTFHDAEATVIAHQDGKGKHKGRMGAIIVQLSDGTEFSIGTGFSDKDRENPPEVGSLVTFRYQELTDGGVPRFPSFVRIAEDKQPNPVKPKAAKPVTVKRSSQSATSATATTSAATSAPISTPTSAFARRFEFSEGNSSKFWEVEHNGSDVTTRWGRLGASGQSKTKNFASPEKATAEYNKLVAEKTSKGYVEVSGPASNPSNTHLFAASSSVPADSSDTPIAEVTKHAENSPPIRDELDEVLDDVISQLQDESRNDPSCTMRLQAVPSAPFEAADIVASLSKQIRNSGFSHIGDFMVDGLPIQMRAFLRGGDTFAVITEFGEYRWVELNAANADNTSETWTSVPVHDGLTPPWSTMYRNPAFDFGQLHSWMAETRSDREPASKSAADFQSYFEESYARSMRWRAESAETDDTSTTATTTTLLPTIETTMEHEEKVLAFVHEYKASRNGWRRQGPPDSVASGTELLQMSPTEQVGIVRVCIKRDYNLLDDLLERLLRKKLPFAPTDMVMLAADFKRRLENSEGARLINITAIEQWSKTNELPKEACELLAQARDYATQALNSYFVTDVPKIQSRIDALLGVTGTRLPMKPSENWAVAVKADIAGMPTEKRRLWTELFNCCVLATTGKPNKKWLNIAQPLVAKITQEEFHAFVNKWLPLVDSPWTGEVARWGHPLQIDEVNQTILRGLVWCCGIVEDRNTIRTLGGLAKTSYRTIPNIGPRSQKIGNAVVFTLGAMTHRDAVTQLAVLKVKIKNGSAQRFIESELNKTAERLKIPRDDLEEMSTPAYGMHEVGLRRDELGEFAGELTVDTRGATKLQWFKPDGSPQKTIPAIVERDFGDDLKELKTAAKDIQKMVTVQRERIDSLFLQQKKWPLAAWKERYLDHPLVGIIARRLVWVFRSDSATKAGVFLNNLLLDEHDQPLPTLTDDTTVELWHPITHDLNMIGEWREWFERHSIAQPFKQAHREVYILTDAERQTRVYSNRFAAHVLRQTQLRALASARGWHASLVGGWDGGGDAQLHRYLPAWNITAQFWINAIDEPFNAESLPMTAGLQFVSTDQVRFYHGEHGEYAPDASLVPLTEVPPLVLSEIMRDVDLFVGVASIGNDPNWLDGGQAGHHGDYWTNYSFGAISETAKTRRQVLERLIPRLKIADRCSFEENFLVVRGDIRTYRIHFGSGNIQMAPNNQYLCIVPKPDKSANNFFLPFEGDRTLSIIISKAMLLADDKKIKDPTIISQIQSFT